MLDRVLNTLLKKDRSSHRRCSVRKLVLRNFTKFTGKHLCQSLLFNKVAGLSHLQKLDCSSKKKKKKPTWFYLQNSLNLEEKKTALKTIRSFEELFNLKTHNLKMFYSLALLSDHWRKSNTCQIFDE